MLYRNLAQALFVVVGILLVPFGPYPCASAQNPEAGAGQLMLLKNGSVLQGFIERTASHYTIQTRPGNRLHLPFEKVEVIADTYSEIYWRRLATIGATDYIEQEALFHWCLRYRLWEEAANQMEICKATISDPMIIQRLQRQLNNALTERDRQQASAAKAAAQEAVPLADSAERVDSTDGHTQSSPSTELAYDFSGVGPAGNESFFENFEPVFRPLPAVFSDNPAGSIANSATNVDSADPAIDAQSQPQVMQVGFEEAGEEEPATTNRDISVRELEQYIKNLPKHSFSQFRRAVEPILISKCSACHQKGQQETVMPILLRSRRLPVTIRQSQRNLYSAIRFVDPANADASSLLHAAVTAHGGQEAASLTEDSVDYQSLREWIVLVSNDSNAEKQNPHSNANSGPGENDNLRNSKRNFTSGSNEPKKILQPMTAKNLSDSSSLLRPSSVDRRDAVRPIQIRHSPKLGKLEPLPPTVGEIPSLAKPAERLLPRDDFDPEIFNRQFGRAGLGNREQ
jgi:hypothetical protein